MDEQPVPEHTGGSLRRRFLRVVAHFRARIDRTGLFPDLKGEAGSVLRRSVHEEARMTRAYMLMCALSAGIAALGLLQSSTAVVIGAMLISPLMGPIASMGFGFASLDGHQIRDAVKTVALGAAIGIVTGVLITWLSPIRNATPEIIARTEPTLLDLAVAILSGMAGAYATVQQKGATAIGVAIATALMPPLATVGYGLGVANPAFAFGALLLFMTNLAAIAFSFALVARLSGAARPLARVDIAPRYVLAGLAAFAALAVPLALTLYRVTAEGRAQAQVRQVLAREFGYRTVNIAQLQVRWPLRGVPQVDVLVVARGYQNDAERRLEQRLAADWGEVPEVSLQQVVAADARSQTEAIVAAAVERSTAGMARDVPPLGAIREAIGLPVQALWVNRSERSVQVVPFAAPGWTLRDFLTIEQDAAAAGQGWQVRIVPPVVPELFVPLTVAEGQLQRSPELDAAQWAIDRWGVQGVRLSGTGGGSAGPPAEELVRLAMARLAQAGIRAQVAEPAGTASPPGQAPGVVLRILRDPPQGPADGP